MAGDEPITLDELRPALIDLAGAAALEEVALDRALAREARRASVTVGPSEVERERALLLESMDEAGDSTRRVALLEALRRSRGLGAARFEALLSRNALLRALVQPEVSITPSAIDQAYALRFGERIACRIIVAPTLAAAGEARRRVESGEPFADVAAAVSTDVSAARGGIIGPINPADPSYPQGLRDALAALAVGAVSAPIAVDNGFALVRRDAPATAPSSLPDLDAVRSVCERDARLRQERTLMEERARRLLAEAGVTVFDRGLDAAWRRRTGRE